MEEPRGLNAEVIALARVLRGRRPLRLVTHDGDDPAWQFLDGDHVFERDAVVVTLAEMMDFDPSVRELLDLPVGWYAWRAAPDRPWRRGQGEPPLDLEGPLP